MSMLTMSTVSMTLGTMAVIMMVVIRVVVTVSAMMMVRGPVNSMTVIVTVVGNRLRTLRGNTVERVAVSWLWEPISCIHIAHSFR